MRRPPRPRRSRSLLTAAAALGALAGMLPAVWGAPSDPFTTALPARDTQAPDAGEVRAGDGSVDASTGTAAYSLPLVLPPGRAGMAPSLALSYSSQRPLRGGVAVGWALEVGVIEKDPEVLDGTAFRVSFGGTSERLVLASGDPWTQFLVTYRAERDAGFTRYAYSALTQTWTAYTLDGRVHTFGIHNGSSRWHLTQTRDRFDNRIDYTYAWTTFTPTTGNTYGEHELAAIEYTANPAAGLAAHARVEIMRGAMAMCGAPVGAALDHRFGVLRASGTRPINTIDVKVRPTPGADWQLRRRHRLVYDAAQLSCGSGSALRYLTRFEVTAYDLNGTPTFVPPVTFTYGLPTRALTRTISVPGFGGGERGDTNGPTSTLLDMDGDGWIDRLTIAATTRCRLGIQRGTGAGTFAAGTTWIDLPSARWYDGTAPASIEGCTLSAQAVFRGVTGNGGPACRRETAQVSYSFLDWDGDGLTDIISVVHESAPGTAGGDFPGPIFGPGGGGGELPPPPPSCPPVPPAPERDGLGNYRLRVQRNLGQLGFVSIPSAMVATSPVPLPANPSQASFGEVARPGVPSLVDVTGDGLADAISLTENPSDPLAALHLPGTQPYLYVWPGTGGAVFGARQAWPLPTWSQELQDATWSPTGGWFVMPGTVNVTDLDGDGLADIVVELGTDVLAVVRNMGGSFRAPSQISLAGPVDESRAEFPPGSSVPWAITNGARAHLRQLIDTDADGLPESLYMPPATAGVTAPAQWRGAYLLYGARYAATRYLGTEWEGLEHLVVAANGTWHRASEVLDVTGDGIVDLVEWTAGGAATIRTDGQDGYTAPRLLASVDNGRGAVTRYEYATTTDLTSVALSGQRLAPRHVVRRIVVEPGLGGPAMTTAYQYTEPRHGKDGPLARGRDTFQGFATVTIDRHGQQGMASTRTVQRYAYPAAAADRRALLTEEWTLAYNFSTSSFSTVRMRAIATEELGVLGASSFRSARTTTERTCAAGATMESCAAAPERVRTTVATWTPYRASPTGPVLHHQPTRTDVTATGAPASHTATTFQVRSTTAEYMQATTDVQRGDGTNVMARETTVLDSRFMPMETRSYQDATTTSRTLRVFDGVGNLERQMRPRQVVINGASEWFSYDAHRVLAAGSTNELWHTVYETRDIATGALLERRGPNWRSGLGENGVNGTYYETERWLVDGLGRVRTHLASFDPPAGSVSTTYVLRQIEAFTYVDATLPNRVIATATQDLGTGAAVIGETVHDGLGRVVQTIARRQVAGEPDAVTTYVYDTAGSLRAMHTPDPRVDTGATLTYAWTRDGLGRVIDMVRPDGSGETIVYAGASTTVTERAPSGALGGTSRTVVDGRGALQEVLEHGNAQPTRYAHDALGRPSTVTDAEGTVTSFAYDRQGHRTTITRGARTWRFRYDLDGDQIEAEAPRPAGAAAADYTATVEYDVVGRVTRRTPAKRGQSDALRASLGIGPTDTQYDVGRLGSVSRVTHPFATIDYFYDARGKVSREALSLTPPGATFTVAQHVDRRYDALGAPREITWNDGTAWRYTHDPRGLVADVAWRPSGGTTWTSLATYTRGVTGAPRQRDGHGQRRSWTYDLLGRPVYDRIWRPSTGSTYGERNYAYDGEDLTLVWGHNNGLAADASYTYDLQHRLTGAVGPGAYEAELGYSPAGNVTRARVAGTLDVAPRDVTYRYAAFDPQAVEALLDAGTGAELATLAYDTPGNLVSRGGPLAPPLDLTWDGDDQIRQAVGPGGTERYLFGAAGERLAAIGPDGIRVWFRESETRFTPAGAQVVRWHHVAAGEPVARIAGGTSVELQYADALSNLMLAIGSGGAITASFLYGAFGEVVASQGAEDHRRQWNGEEADAASGLRHYGYRSYDPLLLRWTSADPKYRTAPDGAADMPQRANLYAFSLNNPLRWIDPDGLDITAGPGCSKQTDCQIEAAPETTESERPVEDGAPRDTTEPTQAPVKGNVRTFTKMNWFGVSARTESGGKGSVGGRSSFGFWTMSGKAPGGGTLKAGKVELVGRNGSSTDLRFTLMEWMQPLYENEDVKVEGGAAFLQIDKDGVQLGAVRGRATTEVETPIGDYDARVDVSVGPTLRSPWGVDVRFEVQPKGGGSSLGNRVLNNAINWGTSGGPIVGTARDYALDAIGSLLN